MYINKLKHYIQNTRHYLVGNKYYYNYIILFSSDEIIVANKKCINKKKTTRQLCDSSVNFHKLSKNADFLNLCTKQPMLNEAKSKIYLYLLTN